MRAGDTRARGGADSAGARAEGRRVHPARLPAAGHRVGLPERTLPRVPRWALPASGAVAQHSCLCWVKESAAAPAQPKALPGWGPGMPEEMVTVWKLWRRGYAAVAVGPLNGGGDWRCYATGMDDEELEIPEVPEVQPHAPNLFTVKGACRHLFQPLQRPAVASLGFTSFHRCAWIRSAHIYQSKAPLLLHKAPIRRSGSRCADGTRAAASPHRQQVVALAQVCHGHVARGRHGPHPRAASPLTGAHAHRVHPCISEPS